MGKASAPGIMPGMDPTAGLATCVRVQVVPTVNNRNWLLVKVNKLRIMKHNATQLNLRDGQWHVATEARVGIERSAG